MPFNLYKLKLFAQSWNFNAYTSSPEFLQSNGLAEKGVHICKKFLKKWERDNTNIEIALGYRCTSVSTLGVAS